MKIIANCLVIHAGHFMTEFLLLNDGAESKVLSFVNQNNVSIHSYAVAFIIISSVVLVVHPKSSNKSHFRLQCKYVGFSIMELWDCVYVCFFAWREHGFASTFIQLFSG